MDETRYVTLDDLKKSREESKDSGEFTAMCTFNKDGKFLNCYSTNPPYNRKVEREFLNKVLVDANE